MDLDIPRELRVLHPRGQVRSRQNEAELTVTIRAWGFGFGVWGLGVRVWGLGFRVWGLGFRVTVEGCENRAPMVAL